jgi:hypothetical protein
MRDFNLAVGSYGAYKIFFGASLLLQTVSAYSTEILNKMRYELQGGNLFRSRVSQIMMFVEHQIIVAQRIVLFLWMVVDHRIITSRVTAA